jgi:hypothetical protein
LCTDKASDEGYVFVCEEEEEAVEFTPDNMHLAAIMGISAERYRQCGPIPESRP